MVKSESKMIGAMIHPPSISVSRIEGASWAIASVVESATACVVSETTCCNNSIISVRQGLAW